MKKIKIRIFTISQKLEGSDKIWYNSRINFRSKTMVIELYNKKNPFLYPSWYVSKVKNHKEEMFLVKGTECGEKLEEEIIRLVSRLNNHSKQIARIAYNVSRGHLYFFCLNANRIKTQLITEKLHIILYPWKEQFEISIKKNGKITRKLWIVEKIGYNV